MDKIFAVARREFLATVRTKAFILSVVLMPGLIIGGIFGVDKVHNLSQAETQPVRRLAIVDGTGVVYPELAAQVARYNAEHPNQPFEAQEQPPGTDTAALRRQVREGTLYGYVLLDPNAVTGDGGGVLARRDNQLESGRRLEDMIREAVNAVRLRDAGIDPAEVAALRSRPVPIEQWDAKTSAPVATNELARLLTPFAFMLLLFMGTFGIAQGLLTTVIEEKSSRVVEVLLSAVSPVQLMAGKIVGMVLVGFLLLGVWSTVGVLGARTYHVAELVTAYRLILALLYFVPGFLLMSSLLAAIGSACNELKEAQSMVFPLSLITIVPMMFWFFIAENPTSSFSIILSYIPPITPFVMILRICADPDTPLWQIVTTLALLWASVVVAIWAAGKVFRVGVLMYGKPPSVRELLRWVRYS
jgi:ABC-2 type transport system permease protein